MAQANAEASTKPRITARLVAAWMFHRDPYLSDADLNRALAEIDMPHDRFVRKDGSHYRRLWKQGRLPPPPDTDPRTW